MDKLNDVGILFLTTQEKKWVRYQWRLSQRNKTLKLLLPYNLIMESLTWENTLLAKWRKYQLATHVILGKNPFNWTPRGENNFSFKALTNLNKFLILKEEKVIPFLVWNILDSHIAWPPTIAFNLHSHPSEGFLKTQPAGPFPREQYIHWSTSPT